MRTSPLLLVALFSIVALACGDDADGTDSTTPGNSGSGGASGSAQAGQGGGSGKGGSTAGGQGGSAGSAAGKGGSAGQGGDAGQGGSAGSAGEAGSGGASGEGQGGEAGSAGQAGSAGDGGSAGQGGDAGSGGASGAGASGSAGASGGSAGDGGSAGASGAGAGGSAGGSAGSAGGTPWTEPCNKAGEVCDGAGTYCDYENNRCNPTGVSGKCKDRPTSCDANYAPVCACDGKTYGNACEARLAGVDIADRAECPPPDGYFQCGHTFCKTGEHYCRWNWSVQPSFSDAVECVPIPKSCKDPAKASCDCFNSDFFPGACCLSKNDGEVSIVYLENGVGDGPNGCQSGW